MITATKSEVESMGEQLKRIQAQAFEQGRQAGLKEAVEIVKKHKMAGGANIKLNYNYWNDSLDKTLEALLKEVEK